MASYSVSNNHYLRMIYMGNTEVTKKTERGKFSSSKLSIADSQALRKGLARLADYDMDAVADDDEKKKKDLYNTMKAFQDAYNYSLDSGSASQNKSVEKLTNQMKKLSSDHAKELSNYGITFDDKGYMSIKNSAVDNISSSKYKKILGKDSEYAKELSDIAKKLSKTIDIAV